MTAIEESKIKKVIMLLMKNDNMSAHKVSLVERAKNRREAIDRLCEMVDMTPEEAQELYEKHI